MTCDCCDEDRADLAPYDDGDGDAVLLCGECVQTLTEMTEGTDMEGTFP